MTEGSSTAATWAIEHDMMVRRVGVHDGSSVELVWIHGLGEQSASFDPVVAALPGFAHVLPDLPGYGRSPWPADPPSLDAVADHLVRWLAARPPVVLVGHSMGGVLATLVAERLAVRGVVDVDGNLTRGDCTFSLDAAAHSPAAFVAGGFAAMRDAVYRRGLDDGALRGYHAAMVLAAPAVFHRHSHELVAISDPETLAGRLVGLTAPHLFVAGGVAGGICAHSRALLDRHGARWLAIEPSGHWPFVDQPAAFAAAVASFAREIR